METLVTRISTVLAALAGLVGYPLLIGGVVVAARARREGLPYESVVAATPNNELFVFGAGTIAAWGLVLALAALTYLVVTAEPGVVGGRVLAWAAVAGVPAGFYTVVAIDGDGWAFAPAGAAVLLWLGVLFRSRAAPFRPFFVGVLAATFAAAVQVLFQNGNTRTLLIVLGLAALLLVLGWLFALRDKYMRVVEARLATVDKEERDALAQVPRERRPLVHAAYAEERARIRPQGFALLGRRALIVYAAFGVGAAAVLVPLDRSNAYNHARVTLENGKCVEGSFVTRNDHDILLAGELPAAKKQPAPPFDRQDEKPVLLTIARDDVAELQVVGPRRPVTALSNADCPFALAKPTAGEAEQGAAVGPTGPTGAHGAKGTRGKQGKRGRRGPRGTGDSDG